MQELSRKQFLERAVGWSRSALLCPLLHLTGCSNRGSPEGGESPHTSAQQNAHNEAAIDPTFTPGYVKLHSRGELKKRGESLWEIMESCQLCPRTCGARRLAGESGFCQASSQLLVAAQHPHFGEEDPLVGTGGSGTVFFTHCSLRCVFCINSEISQGGVGRESSLDRLADMMLGLQRRGCHNINIVTPTHYSAHLLLALDRAAKRGLRLPLVYNTHGWERQEILRLLDGVVDIYLPDFKYWRSEEASLYSSEAASYPEVARAALLEMHRQVGTAQPRADGLMYRGLMIRHLVMPNDVGGSVEIVRWIARNLPADTYLNIMSQYRPSHRARDYPRINRKLHRGEYEQVVQAAQDAGLSNLDIQGYHWLG